EGPARTEESISAIISDENADLFVTETNNQIIGFVHVLTRQAPPVPIMVSRRYAVLENLAIREGYRRLGVGTSLLKRAHQWALSRKVSQIESNVWEFNEEAITFYRKHGYTTTRRWISRRLPQLIPITPVQRTALRMPQGPWLPNHPHNPD
ncbi:unnamed protein product, partial [marine sediment metagenome]